MKIKPSEWLRKTCMKKQRAIESAVKNNPMKR